MMNKRSAPPTLDDEHQFLQEIIDLLAEDGLSDKEIDANLVMLDRLFQLQFREGLDYCHRIVDCIGANLLPYPYTYQVLMLKDFIKVMEIEFARTMGEAVMNSLNLAERIQDIKDISETDDVSAFYGEEDDEVKAEYKQRDAALIAFLRADDEVRQLVEKRVGATIEEIWGIKPNDEFEDED